MGNYHLEIPFYFFVVCDEDGDDDNDDVFIGFRIRETLVCIWAQDMGFTYRNRLEMWMKREIS